MEPEHPLQRAAGFSCPGWWIKRASVSLAMAYRLGGRIELGAWIDLSVEGDRTAQAGGAEPHVALDGHFGW